ncbi:octapeptide-repeat protein T2-like [Arachis ipaensis]|uniref:octapeptide-repeat protein T2-like n=1 Tax=Arachis ipaensis TaxID=130454 RepID=UPI000A2B4365|nr:octapeptide-repeat protein T2-like [Arachis ipaensis]XP_025628593.1 octapeptide-repeat protein T2-like [Arachis hypogaea]
MRKTNNNITVTQAVEQEEKERGAIPEVRQSQNRRAEAPTRQNYRRRQEERKEGERQRRQRGASEERPPQGGRSEEGAELLRSEEERVRREWVSERRKG